MKRSLLSSFIIIISVLLSINILINICSKKDATEETLFYTKNLQEEFDLLVSFKNIGRNWGVYLSATKEDINKIKEKKYPLGDPYNIPKYPEIKFVIKTTQELYDKTDIGDRLHKLPNSNKCYLYKGDSIFKYNCYLIPEQIKEKINIDEWDNDEIGYWKTAR